MNPLPITPPATSHPRRRHQGPLDKTWRSLHRHHRRRPPSPSLSATAAIVANTGLVVAWCRLPPPSSSPLPSNTAATLPTTASLPLRLVLLPPCDPPPRSLSHPLRPLDNPWHCHGPHAAWMPFRSDALSAAPTRTPLVGRRAHCASAAITATAMPWSPLRRLTVDPPSGRATAMAARRR